MLCTVTAFYSGVLAEKQDGDVWIVFELLKQQLRMYYYNYTLIWSSVLTLFEVL